MSLGERIPFDQAFRLAEHVAAELKPVCAEAKAAGSLRRRRQMIGDLEFVVRPRMQVTDLLGGETPDLDPIRVVAARLGTLAKNGDRQIQVRNVLGSSIDLELYVVHPPANWWSILAIRTGPAELGKLAVTRMRANGLAHRDGRIVDAATGIEHPVNSEEDFFKAANLVCLAPHLRDSRDATAPLVERFRAER